MKLIGALFILLSTISAHAMGSVGHGGGKAFACNENGVEKVYLADTYKFIKSGATKGLEKSWPDSVIESVATLLETLKPEKNLTHPFLLNQKVSAGWMVEHVHANLDFEYVDSLPDLPDDHIPKEDVPPNCQVEQLAIQDVGQNHVRVVYRLLSKMSQLERGFFELHETMIAIRGEPGQDTTPIRAEVLANANFLNDPNFSAHELIMQTMIGPSFVPYWPEPSWVDNYIQKNCQTDIGVILNPQLNMVGGLLCGPAKLMQTILWKQKDKTTAFPTLLHVPEVLNCKVTSIGKRMLPFNPKDFDILRIKGNGEPKQDNAYEIQFADGSQNTNMKFQALQTLRHDRQRGIDNIGTMDLRISWQESSGNSLGLFIYKYIQRTDEFTGSLQLQNNKPDKDSKWSSVGVSCHSDKVQFGQDRKSSY